MAQQQESGPTGTKIHTQEVLTENIVCHRLCTRKGTQVSEIVATAKQGVYPKGDTFRGILELQLEAAVLELMVLGKLKKGNGSAGAVLKAPRARAIGRGAVARGRLFGSVFFPIFCVKCSLF